MSNVADADLIFVCAELIEISARINALHVVLIGDPQDSIIKAKLDALGDARSELRKRLRDMSARTMLGLRAKSEMQALFVFCTGRDVLPADALRRMRTVLRGARLV